jgi:dTDP-4-amino-4,6-dideoxygalactose transaminase
MGLCVLEHLEEIFESRRQQHLLYDQVFANTSVASPLKWRAGSSRNYAYYPVLFQSEEILLNVVNKLHEHHIFPRRYFYPSLDQIRELGDHPRDCPVSDSAAKRILCIPMAAENESEAVSAVLRKIL